MTNAVCSNDDVVVNTVFSFESYHTVSYLLVLPAGGVFQTEPPGGCLRQALDSDRIVYCQAGGEQRTVDFAARLGSVSFYNLRGDGVELAISRLAGAAIYS
eukprot:scaffold2720_cov52-Cyclotella_meneghiniana.AAC.2